MAAALGWVLIFVVLDAALRPAWIGEGGLLTLAFVGAGILWNINGIVAAWRNDQAAKRKPETP